MVTVSRAVPSCLARPDHPTTYAILKRFFVIHCSSTVVFQQYGFCPDGYFGVVNGNGFSLERAVLGICFLHLVVDGLAFSLIAGLVRIPDCLSQIALITAEAASPHTADRGAPLSHGIAQHPVVNLLVSHAG